MKKPTTHDPIVKKLLALSPDRRKAVFALIDKFHEDKLGPRAPEPPPRERVFCKTIELALTASETRALHYFNRTHFGRESNIAMVAYWILMLLLNHPRKVHDMLSSAVKYWRAEGIDNQRRYLVDAVAAQREYKREKIPS
jgi:hypothetical protein